MASHKSLKNKKVLITCGPTWVPIDSMRVISNRSSGALGQALALKLQSKGASVTLLEGPVERRLKSKSIKVIKFLFYTDLVSLLKNELKKRYDVVIHAAAVSDYKLKKAHTAKLSSHRSKVKLDLVPTSKIIDTIKRLSRKSFLVGFKLESKVTKKSLARITQRLFKDAKCDLVVANSLNGESYAGYIINSDYKILNEAKSRSRLTNALIQTIDSNL